MGFPSRIRIPKFEPLTFHLYQFHLLLLCLVKVTSLFKKACDPSEEDTDHESVDDDQYSLPSPWSLVQLPVHFMVGSELKERLPVMEFGCFLTKRVVVEEEEEEVSSSSPCECAVCLNFINPSDEVRELCNCSHAFHRKCLDGWVDQGQATCPLCRSKLLLDEDDDDHDQNGKFNCRGDPWRGERMIYLFGQDLSFFGSSFS